MNRRAETARVLCHAGDFRALETALWRELDSVRSREPLAPVVVLVPTNLLRHHLAAQAARRGGCINVHFLTLLDLARELGEPAMAAAGRAQSPPMAGELLARAACRAVPNTYFASIANRPGFHRALLATITDLKEAGHDPAALSRCVARRTWQTSPLLAKLRDLAALWGACEQRLRELGLYDATDLMAAAAGAAGDDPWLAQAAAVLVYGFYDLNEVQRRLVAAATASRRACVFFPYVPDAEAFRYAAETFEWFVAQDFRPQAEPVPALPGELAALQRGLFAPPAGQAAPGGRIRIVSAPDQTREARAVVRAAVAAARGGTPLPRVGILLRQASTYAPLVAEECAAGGLQAYHHTPLPLSTTRAGRSFLMLLRLIGSDLARTDVMDFVTYADMPVAGAETAEWDLLSMQAGVVKGRESWQRRLAARRRALDVEAEEEETPRVVEQRQALDAFVAFLDSFLPEIEAVPLRGTWTRLVDATVALYSRFVRASDERATVAERIAELRTLDATGEEADLATFARLAHETLENAHLARPPFGSRGPAVVDLMEARGLPFDLVCVPGLVENGFPASPGADPLLSDQERLRLSDAGLRLPLKGRRGQEERLLFTLAVAAASEQVLLTYPRLEPSSGRARVPSHFLLRVVEAATGARCSYQGLGNFAGHERISASALAPEEPSAAWCEAEYDLAVVRRALVARKGAGLGYLCQLAPTFGSAWRAEARRWDERQFTPYDGVLSDAASLAALAERLGPPPWRTDASSLERYAQCPFQFFLRHILGVEALEEPEAVRRISGLDRGSVLHRILCRALREARDARRIPLSAEDEARVLETARQAFAEFEQHGLVGCPALWQLERECLERDLRQFVRQEAADTSGYLPAHFEAAFGARPRDPEHEPWSPQGLDLDLGEAGRLHVTGRMDRIDLTRDRSRGRVVDYKTGKVPRGHRDNAFAGGTTLQLPIYLRAAEALLRATTMDAALYRYVTEAGGYATVEFTREAAERRNDEFLTILATIAEGVRRGRFFAGVPSGTCDFCDYRPVCGAAARAAARLKVADTAVERFLKMREIE
ncbi:MAG TPA: PD-(D/E)XK nuclease family protein [Planctomycetota bacterium]|nr:PD-(D/E)XK nuclease family protein [Planctomycetota bacterium]